MKLLYALPIRWGAVLFAGCILAAPAPSLAAHPSHSARLISPKQVVLRLSDVARNFGKGFTRSSAGPLPRQNAAAANTALHTTAYTKLIQDWVSGYTAEYTNLFTPPGGITVTSTVNVYNTAGIAQKTAEATFASRVALTKHAGAGFYTSALTRYSGVGQYAELTTNVSKSVKGGKASHLPGAYQVQITFTRGHYAVSIQVVSSATIRMSAVLSGARLMDSRLHGG